jgi:hypothetical protein
MTNLLRRALIALALIAGISPVIAQTFPTVPGQSVIGRRGQPGDTGPSQAILYGTLRSDLKIPTIPSIFAVDSGVKCDGVTDDAPAIQRAINAADALTNVQIVMPRGTCLEKSATPFLNKWATAGILTVPGLNIVGQGKGVTTLDNQTGGFAISVNPDWRAAHLSLSGITSTTGGTGLPTNTYYVQITVNTPQGDEVFVMLPKSIAVTSPGQISITLAPLNAGYSYNAYCDTTPTPAHYCFVNGTGIVSAFNGGQTISINALGTARTVPTNKLAVWQQAHVADMSVTSSTNTAGSSCISYFKVGYSDVTNVYCHHLQGTGFELTDYTGDLDGSFMVGIKNSKFDTISGWCVDASGLALEMSNFTVEDRTIFNICGTLPTNYIQPQNYGTSGFTISSITNSTTPVVTTSVAHTLQTNDQVYIRGVAGMTLADGWYRATVLSGTTYNLKDLNGAFIDTTSLGAYTASSGRSMLAWRPPSPTNGVTGCLRWMGLIGTFRDSDFTQCNNVAMYFTELGSSDNATIEGVDLENTYGKALYATSLTGGTLSNFECLSAVAFGPTISCVQLGTGFAAGGVQNFKIGPGKVRSDVTPATAFEQFPNTSSTGTFSDTVRFGAINWQAFDAAGQARTNTSGFTFDPIPGQVKFSISSANVAKLVPIGIGASLPIHLKANGEWVAIRIPSAGVTQGSIGGLSATTTYNFYAYNSAATSAPYVISMEASTAAPTLSDGYFVKTGDASRTFVGTAKTDGSGNFQTSGAQTSQYPASSLPVGTNGQFLAGVTGADPAFVTMSQDGTITAAGVLTVTKTNNVAFATVATSASAADLTTGTLNAARLGFAAKTDMQTPTSTTLVVNPRDVQDHPGVAKFHARIDGKTGATCTVTASYNITGCVRNSAGNYTLTFTTAFANANYDISGTAFETGVASGMIAPLGTFATTTLNFACVNPASGAQHDCDVISIQGFGTQ